MALRPLDPSIVNFYQPPKLNMPDPLQDLASIEQIKSGKASRQLHEQQLAQLQRDSAALDKMREVLVSKGQSPDLDVAADEMIKTGIPNVMDVGLKMKQKLDFQRNFKTAMGGGEAAPAQPAPVATTAPVQGPVMSLENLSGGGTGIKMRSNLPEQAPAPASTNALTPSGFPTNFGENTMAQLRQLERQREGLSMLAADNPQITPMVAELSRQIAELRKPQTFSPGQTVVFPGQAPITLPEKSAEQPSLVKEYNFAKTQDGGGFKGSYQDFVVARSAATRPPAQPLAPIPTLDRTTGQVVYATREQILQNPRRFVPTSERQEPKFDAGAGGFVYAPTSENPQGKFVAVTGVEGKPLNETQGSSVAYGIRMKEANSVLEDLAKSGTEKSAIGAGAPYGIGAAVNLLTASPQQQQVQQAKVNFITAILRKESGAAIGQDEFAREDEKYFPQRGDSDAVLSQKKQARQTAIRAMEIQAGPGAKEIQKFSPRGEPTTKSNPAVDDLVKKYGG